MRGSRDAGRWTERQDHYCKTKIERQACDCWTAHRERERELHAIDLSLCLIPPHSAALSFVCAARQTSRRLMSGGCCLEAEATQRQTVKSRPPPGMEALCV